MLEKNGPEKKSDYGFYVDKVEKKRYKLTANDLAEMKFERYGYSYQDPVCSSRNVHDAFNYRMRGLSNWNEVRRELAIKGLSQPDISKRTGKKPWKVLGFGKVGLSKDDLTPSTMIFYSEDDGDKTSSSTRFYSEGDAQVFEKSVREKIDATEKKSIDDILKGTESKESTVKMDPAAYVMLVEKEFERLDQEVTAFSDLVKKTRKSVSESRENALKEGDPDILKSLVSVIEAMFGLAQTTFLNAIVEDSKRRLERLKDRNEDSR